MKFFGGWHTQFSYVTCIANQESQILWDIITWKLDAGVCFIYFLWTVLKGSWLSHVWTTVFTRGSAEKPCHSAGQSACSSALWVLCQPRVQNAVCICQLDSQLAAVHYGCCVSPEYRVQSVSVSWTVSLQQCTVGAVSAQSTECSLYLSVGQSACSSALWALCQPRVQSAVCICQLDSQLAAVHCGRCVSPEYRVQSVSVSWTVSLQQCTVGAVSAQSTECSLYLSVGQSACSSALWALCQPRVQSAVCICQLDSQLAAVHCGRCVSPEYRVQSVSVSWTVSLQQCTVGAVSAQSTECSLYLSVGQSACSSALWALCQPRVQSAVCICQLDSQLAAVHCGRCVSPEYRVQSVSVSWTVSLQQCTVGAVSAQSTECSLYLSVGQSACSSALWALCQPRVQSAVCQLDSQFAAVHYGSCVSPEYRVQSVSWTVSLQQCIMGAVSAQSTECSLSAGQSVCSSALWELCQPRVQSAVCQLDSQFAAVHYGSCVSPEYRVQSVSVSVEWLVLVPWRLFMSDLSRSLKLIYENVVLLFECLSNSYPRVVLLEALIKVKHPVAKSLERVRS